MQVKTIQKHNLQLKPGAGLKIEIYQLYRGKIQIKNFLVDLFLVMMELFTRPFQSGVRNCQK